MDFIETIENNIISKRYSKGIDDPLFTDICNTIRECCYTKEEEEYNVIRLCCRTNISSMFLELKTEHYSRTIILLKKQGIHKLICIAFPELHQQLINKIK